MEAEIYASSASKSFIIYCRLIQNRMPYSTYNGKDIIIRWLNVNKSIKSAVDFGAGSGWYGKTLKYCRPDIKITAIEAHDPYLDRFNLKQIYDTVISGKIELVKWPDADLAIFGDVLEHIQKAQAIEIVKVAEQRYKNIIINIPIGHWPQGSSHGNELEAHLSEWTFDELCLLFDWPIKLQWEDKAIFIKYAKPK